MEKIEKNNTNFSNKELLEMSLRSTSGCKIQVGERIYNTYYNSNSEIIIDEFITEFKLTEEEFEKLKSYK